MLSTEHIHKVLNNTLIISKLYNIKKFLYNLFVQQSFWNIFHTEYTTVG